MLPGLCAAAAVLYCKMCVSESVRELGITTRGMLVTPTYVPKTTGQARDGEVK